MKSTKNFKDCASTILLQCHNIGAGGCDENHRSLVELDFGSKRYYQQRGRMVRAFGTLPSEDYPHNPES